MSGQIVVTPPPARAASTLSTPQRVTQVALAASPAAQLQSTFETLSKNIAGLPAVITRGADGAISAVVYGNGELVKTLQRTSSGAIAAVVLTGSKLGSYELTKTFSRGPSGELTGLVYSQRTLP